MNKRFGERLLLLLRIATNHLCICEQLLLAQRSYKKAPQAGHIHSCHIVGFSSILWSLNIFYFATCFFLMTLQVGSSEKMREYISEKLVKKTIYTFRARPALELPPTIEPFVKYFCFPKVARRRLLKRAIYLLVLY